MNRNGENGVPSGAAAWHGMVTMGGLATGQTVLILDADRDTGAAALKVAQHVGAEIITHGRAPAGADPSKIVSVRPVLTASADNLRDALFDMTGGVPVDMVVDGSGGDIVRPALRCLKWLGAYVSLAGVPVDVPANYPLIKGLSVIGVDSQAMQYAPSVLEQQSIRDAAAVT